VLLSDSVFVLNCGKDLPVLH